jgi:hypothetical protein
VVRDNRLGAAEVYAAPAEEKVPSAWRNFSSDLGFPPCCRFTVTINSGASTHGMDCVNRFAKSPCLRCASYILELGLRSSEKLPPVRSAVASLSGAVVFFL